MSRARQEALRAKCRLSDFALQPGVEDNSTEVDIHMRVRLAPYFRQPITFCLLLDGEHVVGALGMRDASRRMAAGETVDMRAAVRAGGSEHSIYLNARFGGAGAINGYHFELQVEHPFTIDRSGSDPAGAADFVIELKERPMERRYEQRPTVEFFESGSARHVPVD